MGTFLQDMAAQQRAASRPRQAPVKKSGGGGILSDIAGGIGGFLSDVTPDLGLGNAGKMATGLFPGLWHLASDWGTKGLAHGDWSTYKQAAQGLGTSILDTAATVAKPVGGDFWMEPLVQQATGYRPRDLLERARDPKEGLLPAIINDVGNVALVGGAAAKLAKAGEVGALAGDTVAAEAAAEAPGSAARLKAATKAATRAEKAQTAAESAGRVIDPEAVAARAAKIRTAETFAHPYQAVFNKVLRPVTSLADARTAAGAAAEGATTAMSAGELRSAKRAAAGAVAGEGSLTPEEAFAHLRAVKEQSDAAAVEASRTKLTSAAQAVDQALVPEDLRTYVAQNPDLPLEPHGVIHTGSYDKALMDEVAQKYDAPDYHQPDNPEVRAQYEGGTPEHPVGFLEQVKRQFLKMTAPVEAGGMGIKVDFHGPDVPEYANNTEMRTDLHMNRHIKVRDTALHGDHPNEFMAQVDPETGLSYNDMFRAVHDTLGHAHANDFGRAGEVTAFKAHASWFTPDVQPALANETLAQTASLIGSKTLDNLTGQFPEQKAGLLDPELVQRALEGQPKASETIQGLDNAPPPPPREMPTVQGRDGPITGVRPAQSPAAANIAAAHATRLANAPGWSRALVDRLPQPVVEALAGVEHIIQHHEVNRVAREMSRIVEASRRNVIVDPAVQIAVQDVAQHLRGQELPDGTIINAALAGDLVGAEIQARLTGMDMLAQAGTPEAQAVLQEAIDRIASQDRRIPPKMVQDLGLEDSIVKATAEWRRVTNERVATLIGGRLGTAGLENLAEDVPLMTKRTQKAWRQLQRLMQERTKWEARAEGQLAKVPGEIERIDTSIDKVLQGAVKDQAAAVDAAQQVRHLYEQHPFGDDPNVRDKALADLSDATIQGGGGTLDTVSGELITDSTYSVAVRSGTLRQVTADVFGQRGPEILREVIDGDHIFRDGRVRLGTWKHTLEEDTMIDGQMVPAGTDVVDIDPSIDSWSADPTNPKSIYRKLTKQQAIIIGKSLGQDSIWDFKGDTAIPTKVDPRVGALNSMFVDLSLNPKTAFSAYAGDLESIYTDQARAAAEAGVAPGLHPDDINAQLQADMVMAYSWAKAHGKVDPTGRPSKAGLDEYFNMRRAEFKRSKNPKIKVTEGFEQGITPEEMNQVMLNLDLTDPAVVDRMKELTPNAQDRIAWYDRSHAGVERHFRGQEVTLGDGTVIDAADLLYQLLAVTSFQTNPVTNLGYSLGALANWKEFRAGMGPVYKQYARNMNKFLKMEPLARTHESMVSTLLDGVGPKERTGSAIVKGIGAGTGIYANKGDHLKGLTAILSGHTLDKWDPQTMIDLNVPWGGRSKAGSAEAALADITDEEWARAEHEAAAFPGSSVEQRAMALHHGSDAWAKVLSFWQNLADPANSQAVTLDTWMARAFGIQSWSNVGDYYRYTEKVAAAAKAAGMAPHQLQALIWTYAKAEITRQASVRAFGATTAASDLLKSGVRLGGAEDPIIQMFDYEVSRQAEWEKEVQAWHDAGRPTGQKPRKGLINKVTVPTATEHGAPLGKEEMLYQRPTAPKDLATIEGSRAIYLQRVKEIHALMDAGDEVGAQQKLAAWANEYNTSEKVGRTANDFSDFLDNATGKVKTNMDRLAAMNGRDLADIMPDLADEIVGKVTGFTRINDTGQRMMMRFFRGANIETLLHENLHVLRQILPAKDIHIIEKAMGVPGIFSTSLGDPLRLPMRRAAEELFVKEFMGHFLSGRSENPALQPIFDRLQIGLRDRHTIGNRYGNLTVGQPDELAAIWDKYLDPALPEQPVANDLGLMGRESARTAEPGVSPEMLVARNRPLPGETADRSLARQRTMSRALERKHMLETRASERIKRVARLQKAKTEMEDVLRTHGVPAQQQVDKLTARIDKMGNRIEQALLDPKTSQVPPVWQPMKQALDKLWEEAADDPTLTAAMEGMPKTFGDILALAAEKGFDPTHVRSFTPTQVQRLVHETISLGVPGRNVGQEIVAGTRKPRVSGIPRTQSLDALIAASVEATHEVQTNELVSFIEEHFARPIHEGTIPNTHEAWDPVRNWFVNRSEPLPSGANTKFSPQPTMMIPKSVARALRNMSKDYSHSAFRILGKPSSWWRTYLLTLTPRWYVNNFVGNFALAEAEGVKLKDWQAAWKSYRQRSAKGSGRTAVAFSDIPGVTGASVYHELGSPTVVGERSGIKGLIADSKGQPTKEKWFQIKHRLARANESVDEIARAAVYHHNLRTTGSAEVALQRSYEALIDYGDLGPLERSLVRAVVPFYAWQKGILKAVAKLGIEHPGAFAIMQRISDLNSEMLKEKYGSDVPDAYQGIIDLPGGGAINTRGLNPFADAGQLVRSGGIGESINPFVEAIVRNELNAPQTTRPEDYRINPFGRVVPETNVAQDITETFSSGLPQGQLAMTLAGQSPYTTPPSNLQAIERFGGINAMSKADLQRIIQRMTQSEATLNAKPKRKGTSTSSLGGPFMRLTGR